MFLQCFLWLLDPSRLNLKLKLTTFFIGSTIELFILDGANSQRISYKYGKRNNIEF